MPGKKPLKKSMLRRSNKAVTSSPPQLPTFKKYTPPSEFPQYVKVLIVGMLVFGGTYAYTVFLQIGNPVNKAVADTSIILIGLSMLLSSLGYFWNFFDPMVVYRKHLGLIGFAFGLLHMGLSYSALLRLMDAKTWEQQTYWPALTGLIALVIFTIMAAISNRYATIKLGGKLWRYILRTGYIAILFVLAHVVLLKLGRWQNWYSEGMKTLPAMSMIVSVFMIIVFGMRIAMWWSLRNKTK